MNKLLAIIFLLFANSVFAIDIDEAIKSTIEKNPKVKIAYEKLWSNKSKLMCPRSVNGTLHCPSKKEAITPYPFEKQYTESDGLYVKPNLHRA